MKKLFFVFLTAFLTINSFAATTYLNLTCLIEGYHIGNGVMTDAAVNQGCPWAVPDLSDRVLVQLRKSTAPYAIVAQSIANLPTSGNINSIALSHSSLKSGQYFIVVKNTRNAIETWSRLPVAFTLGATSSYDFTRDPASAYGSNMKKVGGVAAGYPLGIWAFYSGDVNQDGCIDLLDDTMMEDAVLNFAYGCVTTDLNGDGNVDLLDLAIFQGNPLGAFICVMRP